MGDPVSVDLTAAPHGARLFLLEVSVGQILSMTPNGGDRRVLAQGCKNPDGIAVDLNAGHIYWTNMGIPPKNDGSIERIDLDGGNRTTIVPPGGTFTPKQLHLDPDARKLYWADREGMRVMRSNLDGSGIEVLIQTGATEADRAELWRWCVGVAVDPDRLHIYWTQKGPANGGVGRLMRAGLDLPAGEGPARRSDIEVLLDHLPEPIDLDIDLENGVLYWTDRGDPPSGNTVTRVSIDGRFGERLPPTVVLDHLMEGIGICLDPPHGRMFVTDLAGSVYSAATDGSQMRMLAQPQGNLTGIAYAELAATEN